MECKIKWFHVCKFSKIVFMTEDKQKISQLVLKICCQNLSHFAILIDVFLSKNRIKFDKIPLILSCEFYKYIFQYPYCEHQLNRKLREY